MQQMDSIIKKLESLGRVKYTSEKRIVLATFEHYCDRQYAEWAADDLAAWVVKTLAAAQVSASVVAMIGDDWDICHVGKVRIDFA